MTKSYTDKFDDVRTGVVEEREKINLSVISSKLSEANSVAAPQPAQAPVLKSTDDLAL